MTLAQTNGVLRSYKVTKSDKITKLIAGLTSLADSNPAISPLS